jgi:hypothetical protein
VKRAKSVTAGEVASEEDEPKSDRVGKRGQATLLESRIAFRRFSLRLPC